MERPKREVLGSIGGTSAQEEEWSVDYGWTEFYDLPKSLFYFQKTFTSPVPSVLQCENFGIFGGIREEKLDPLE